MTTATTTTATERPLFWHSPFLLPTALALLIVATAPFMGLLRDAVFAVFPRQGLRGVAWVLGILVAILFTLAVLRIREHRAWRYGGLCLVAALLCWQVFGLGRGVAQVDVVERIHIVEYGSLAWLLYRAWRRCGADRLQLFALPLLATLIAGAADESAQRFFQLRVGDYRDVLLNGFAAICGLLFAAIFDPPQDAPRAQRQSGQRVAAALALTLFGLGAFLYYAHLGYEIVDPQLGRFLSYYAADELPGEAEERRRRWSIEPPTGLVPWQRKDLFLDEAARHTNYRNDRQRWGDWQAAWLSNAILEKYYEPFLDADTYRAAGANRWPPEVRAEALRQMGGEKSAPEFRSPVLRGHILAWPHGYFLAIWLGSVALVAAYAAWITRRPSRREPLAG